MKIIQLGNVTVYGEGQAEGGIEVAVIPHPVRGATVIVPWGFDYGGGIHAVHELDEEEYQFLQDKARGDGYYSGQMISDWLDLRDELGGRV